jgi:hypothetical protein
MGLVIVLLFWVLAFASAATRLVPRWLGWAVPVALAAIFAAAYTAERDPTTADGRPGLVALVGLVSVAVALALVYAGLRFRDRTPPADASGDPSSASPTDARPL